jgi:hypothetical protein
MSHTTTVKTQLKDRDIVQRVCDQLGYTIEESTTKREKLFQSQTYSCEYKIKIPGWSYPVLVAEDGTCNFDNYNGSWGDIEKLHKLQRDYAEEMVNDYANSSGYRILDRTLTEDGTIQLRLGQ